MAERTKADFGLIDAWMAELGGPRAAAVPRRLDAAVPLKALARPIVRLADYRGGEKGDRPVWPALTMLKCVMLAKWFGFDVPDSSGRA